MAQSVSDSLRRRNELQGRKQNWNLRAQTAAHYAMPHKATITNKRAEGGALDIDVYDSTAVNDSQIAAAGLQAFMAGADSRWFALKFRDNEMNDDKEAQDWLHDTEEKLYSIFNNSNFNQTMGEYFHDLVVLPGATIYEDEDIRDIVRFSVMPFDEVLIGVNHRGDVDELIRVFKYTVKQIVQRWPKTCGSEVQKMFNDNKLDEKLEILHHVAPRYDRDPSKSDANNMPFYSCFIDTAHKRKFEEKGYMEFPYFVGRWRVNAGEDWGYSPTMVGQADILMLNEMAKVIIQASQIATAPPWLFPDENFVLPLDFNAHAINYRIGNPGATSASEKDPFPLISKANMPISIEMLNRVQNNIHGYYFKDLFLPLLEKQATAFEVAKTIEKKMTILGSVIGGIQRSTLAPIISRTYQIARRLPKDRQILKPVPIRVAQAGANIDVQYVSPLAIAQKSVLLQTTESFLATVGQLMLINPEVKHKVKWDKAVDKIADIQAIDSTLLEGADEYKQLVEADRQAAAQAQSMQMAEMGGKAVKAAGEGAQAVNPQPVKKAA